MKKQNVNDERLRDIVNNLSKEYNVHKWLVAELMVFEEQKIHDRYVNKCKIFDIKTTFYNHAGLIVDRYLRIKQSARELKRIYE